MQKNIIKNDKYNLFHLWEMIVKILNKNKRQYMLMHFWIVWYLIPFYNYLLDYLLRVDITVLTFACMCQSILELMLLPTNHMYYFFVHSILIFIVDESGPLFEKKVLLEFC